MGSFRNAVVGVMVRRLKSHIVLQHGQRACTADFHSLSELAVGPHGSELSIRILFPLIPKQYLCRSGWHRKSSTACLNDFARDLNQLHADVT